HSAFAPTAPATQAPLDPSFFRDRISPGAARDQPDIRRNAARRIVERVDRKHDLGHGDDRVAALVRLAAGMRGPAAGADYEDADALALGHDLAAGARRLGDEHVTLGARLAFNEAA